MLVFLKIIHFLSLSVGIGGGVANSIIGARAARVEPSVRPVLGAVSGLIGKISFGALVLLWLTGIAMVFVAYGGWADLGAAFWVKIVFVAALTALSITLNMLVMRAERTRTPPPAARMKRLGQLAGLCSIIIVISAVIAFTT